MTKKLKVGLIFGGRSGEHEVSLMSARSVIDVIDPKKYEVTQIGINLLGKWVVGENVWQALHDHNYADLTPAVLLPEPGHNCIYALENISGGLSMRKFADLDVIFPVLHGTFGEDGTMQGLLEMADVAYVGAGVLGSSVGMDKALFKDVMQAHDIPVAPSLIVTRSRIHSEKEGLIADLEMIGPYPLFVKPANLGSSVGITKCYNRSDLMEGLLDAARFDRRVLVEKGINGREVEVSVLGNAQPIASVPGEIKPAADFYTYNAKYHDDRSQLFIPADLSPELTEKIRAMAVTVFTSIDCAGLGRVDFLVDRDNGDIFVNEINTIPGFTQISMYPKLFEASGISYSELIDRLIQLALERKMDRDQTERVYEEGK
ncbi:MAG: D-alanine--D-alanine ligase family protein [Anaerolineaceae bacterium]